jgi:predicted oxidoreductase (fatty acid repression mutant protein)
VLDITTPVAEGLDTDMFVNVSYFAIYSETFGGVMQINKWRDMSLVDIAANSLWPKA